MPGRNDAEMGPANSLHASAYYSEYNERFDLITLTPSKDEFGEGALEFFSKKQPNYRRIATAAFMTLERTITSVYNISSMLLIPLLKL